MKNNSIVGNYILKLEDIQTKINFYRDLLIREHSILLDGDYCIKKEFTGCEKDKKVEENKKGEKINTICLLPSSCVLDKSLSQKFRLDYKIGEGFQSQIYSTNNDDIILKVVHEKDNNDDISNIFLGIDNFHEIFVGIYAVNKVCKIYPNFVYTFGYLNCSVTEGCKLLPNCNKKEKNKETDFPLIAIENIPDSKTLDEVLSTLKFSTFLSIFLQVFGALRIINENCGFVHLDLHIQNVMLTPSNQFIKNVLYLSKEEEHNLQVPIIEFIPKIIDYGFSKVIIDEEIYCSKSIKFPEYIQYNFFTDIYKFLGFSLFKVYPESKITQFILNTFNKVYSKIYLSLRDLSEGYLLHRNKSVIFYMKCLILNLLVIVYRHDLLGINKDIFEEDEKLFLYFRYLEENVNKEGNQSLIKAVNYLSPTNFAEFKEWIRNQNRHDEDIFIDFLNHSFQEGINTINKVFPSYNVFLKEILLEDENIIEFLR